MDGFVIKAVSSGTLKIGPTAGTAIAFVAGVTDTVDGTNNAYWTPNLNDTGAAINAFTAVALDNNGAESSIARQAQINIVAVNDAPSGTNNTISLNEDSNYTFVAGDFGFSDPVEGDAFSGVVITVAPTTGSLSLTGSGVVTNGQLIGIADINAGKLVFTPVAGASGTAYSAFSFQAPAHRKSRKIRSLDPLCPINAKTGRLLPSAAAVARAATTAAIVSAKIAIR